MSTVSLILAMSRNRAIGIDNRLPWSLPADMKHFRALTIGKPIVMGRKTFESIGKALPGRRNIVVTRNRTFMADDVEVAHSLDDALALAASSAETMVIGGAEIYAAALPRANRIYLTEVEVETDGDAFFPALDESTWQEVSSVDGALDERNRLPHRFVELRRT